tara:strand:+ start:223 stop:753 length:531 start_codon:yes stop_codon:yes gene_type:complete
MGNTTTWKGSQMDSTDEISTLDTTTMKEVDFSVVSVEDGNPIVNVVGVGGRKFSGAIETTRFHEIVGDIGNTLADVLTTAIEGSATIEGILSSFTEDEKILANYVIEHAAWQFAVKSGLPVFLFHPASIPDEMMITPDAKSTTQAYQRGAGKKGYRKVKKAGKKVFVPTKTKKEDE